MVQQMTEPKLTSGDGQPPNAAKKTALTELPNENRIIVPNASNLTPVKDKVGIVDKVSGTKRPSSKMSINPSCNPSNAPNSPLVYVRRKSDSEIGTNGTEEVAKQLSLITSPISSSLKLKTSPSLPRESSPGMKNVHWEERFMKLQQLLRTLEQADKRDYLHMLRSLSSVDMSWHAVELERRSIQLSLEEAKEMQRVGLLNVLGKPVKN